MRGGASCPAGPGIGKHVTTSGTGDTTKRRADLLRRDRTNIGRAPERAFPEAEPRLKLGEVPPGNVPPVAAFPGGEIAGEQRSHGRLAGAGASLGPGADMSGWRPERSVQRAAERVLGGGTLPPDETERLAAVQRIEPWRVDIRDLVLMPGNTSYVEQVDRVATLMAAGELWTDGEPPALWIDCTGVGVGVLDLARERGLRPVPVLFVAAHQSARVDDGWHVAKGDLVSVLQTGFDMGRVRLAHDLPERARLIDELSTFRVTENPATGHMAFAGARDDAVIALALTVWAAAKGSPPGLRPGPVYHVPAVSTARRQRWTSCKRHNWSSTRMSRRCAKSRSTGERMRRKWRR